MDIVLYIFAGLIVLLFIFRNIPPKGVRQITVSELRRELKDKSKQYIDVRTPQEFKTRNIPGFKNYPLNILPKKLNELEKDKEVVVICQSGMRSRQACKILINAGFKKVTNVKGGMNMF